MIEDYLKDAESRMKKTVSKFKEELKTLRTGRASVSLVENIKVDYYGTEMPLKQLATISIPEPMQIVIQAWDRNAIPAIEKALQEANLGANPQTEGNLIRLILPPMTEERRKELAKAVGKMAEDMRIAIRAIRHDVKEAIEDLKSEGFSEDDIKRGLDKLQKITNKYVDEINELAKQKEEEIMTL